MGEELVLVSGAAGRTGNAAVETLLKLEKPVRALVHQDDERAQALRERGLDVVVGEYGDLDGLAAALEGVSAAYFVYPIKPGLMEVAASFAQAAREAGVKAIVNMSQISARRNSKSNAARIHWLTERILDWAAQPGPLPGSEPHASGSGMMVTHLRPTFFAEWLVYPHWRKEIWATRRIRFPFADGRHAPITAEDQGRFIAHILTDPKPHAGKTYTLHGPVEMDHHGIAAAMSEALGTTISYSPVSIEEFSQDMERRYNMPPFLVQHLAEVARNYQEGVFAGTNDIIEKITGEAPMTVQRFIGRNRDLFV